MIDDGKGGILLFTEKNVLDSNIVDYSYFNHIVRLDADVDAVHALIARSVYQSRLFHVPYSCADPSWLLYHPVLRPLLNDPTTVFRIQGFPKAIERHVAEVLIDEDERKWL